MRTLTPLLLTIATTTTTACVEDVPDDAELASTEQAIYGRSIWTWSTTNAAPYDLMSDANRTCFLSGVAGDLNSGDEWHDGERAAVRVYRDGGRYWIESDSGRWDDGTKAGNKVKIHATCIGTVKNRIEGYWRSDDPPKLLGAVTPQRQCFLSGVFGAGGTWIHDSDEVRVKKIDGNWYLTGTVPRSDVHGNHAGASAVCVDLPEGTTVETYALPAGSFPATIPVGYDDNGRGCGLTGIRGKFNVSSWTNGVMLDWPSPAPGDWTFTASPYKMGFATCVE